MSKQLNLSAGQALSIIGDVIPTTVQINYADINLSSEVVAVEINADTLLVAVVPFANLLTFNSAPLFTSNNAVLEA